MMYILNFEVISSIHDFGLIKNIYSCLHFGPPHNKIVVLCHPCKSIRIWDSGTFKHVVTLKREKRNQKYMHESKLGKWSNDTFIATARPCHFYFYTLCPKNTVKSLHFTFPRFEEVIRILRISGERILTVGGKKGLRIFSYRRNQLKVDRKLLVLENRKNYKTQTCFFTNFFKTKVFRDCIFISTRSRRNKSYLDRVDLIDFEKDKIILSLDCRSMVCSVESIVNKHGQEILLVGDCSGMLFYHNIGREEDKALLEESNLQTLSHVVEDCGESMDRSISHISTLPNQYFFCSRGHASIYPYRIQSDGKFFRNKIDVIDTTNINALVYSVNFKKCQEFQRIEYAEKERGVEYMLSFGRGDHRISIVKVTGFVDEQEEENRIDIRERLNFLVSHEFVSEIILSSFASLITIKISEVKFIFTFLSFK